MIILGRTCRPSKKVTSDGPLLSTVDDFGGDDCTSLYGHASLAPACGQWTLFKSSAGRQERRRAIAALALAIIGW